MHMVIDPRYREIPWDKTHVWIVDERRVVEDHEQSNIRMIRETLVDHVPMRSRQIHAMPVMDDDAADKYEDQLRKHLPEGPLGRLDFILLGMGDDGHTASLFPGSPAQQIEDRWVAINDGPTVTPPDRVTMTYSLINQARQLAVLVTGAKKNATLNRVDQQLFDHGPDIAKLPITGIMPHEGNLTWYLDHDAAGVDS
jgi:6-phosphogluconolactonase